MKIKKLTPEILKQLVREVVAEQKMSFKSDLDRKQHLEKQAKEAEARRQQKDRVLPGYADLLSLSRGVLEESDLLAQPTEEGWVKIKTTALKRILKDKEVLSEEDERKEMNRKGYYKVNQILDFISRLKQAQSGK